MSSKTSISSFSQRFSPLAGVAGGQEQPWDLPSDPWGGCGKQSRHRELGVLWLLKAPAAAQPNPRQVQDKNLQALSSIPWAAPDSRPCPGTPSPHLPGPALKMQHGRGFPLHLCLLLTAHSALCFKKRPKLKLALIYQSLCQLFDYFLLTQPWIPNKLIPSCPLLSPEPHPLSPLPFPGGFPAVPPAQALAGLLSCSIPKAQSHFCNICFFRLRQL